MQRRSSRPWLLSVVTLAVGVGAAAGDPRSRAEGLTATLASASGSGQAELLRAPLQGARQALGRARDARAAGDATHGAQLEALALEWAETGQHLLRADQAEQRAAEVERRVQALETESARARALVEDTVSRRGRAAQALQALEAEEQARKAAPAASAAGSARP